MWQHANIGASTGSAEFDNGTAALRVQSPGTLLTEADGCCFLYQRVEGNFSITVRMAEISNELRTSVAGIMLRESLSENAAHVSCLMVVKTGRPMLRFRLRPKTGAENVNLQNISGVAIPCCLRLCRIGSVFSAFYSQDGSSFTEFSSGAIDVDLPRAGLLGIAITQENSEPGGSVACRTDQIVVS